MDGVAMIVFDNDDRKDMKASLSLSLSLMKALRAVCIYILYKSLFLSSGLQCPNISLLNSHGSVVSSVGKFLPSQWR